MTQMVEIAQTGYDLYMGKMSAFKSGGSAPKTEDKEKKQFGKAKFKGKGRFSKPTP